VVGSNRPAALEAIAISGAGSLEGSFAEAERRPAGRALNRHVKRKKDLLIKVMVPTQTLG
jgi:hypothetical protein